MALCCDRGPKGKPGAQGAQGVSGGTSLAAQSLTLSDEEQKQTNVGTGDNELLYEWNVDLGPLLATGMTFPLGVYVGVIMRSANGHSGGAVLTYGATNPGSKTGGIIAFCKAITPLSATEALYEFYGTIASQPATKLIQLLGTSVAANGGAADATIMRGVTVTITAPTTLKTKDCVPLNCCFNPP